MAQTYYQVLGVSQKAEPEEIQAAFRKLAAEVMPGVNRGEEAANTRMKAINQANSVLRDPEKRREYDLTLSPASAKKAAGTAPPQSNAAASSGPSSSMFRDALDAMREQARVNMTGVQTTDKPAGAARGTPVDIVLTRREAVEGAIKQIKVDGKLIWLNIRIER